LRKQFPVLPAETEMSSRLKIGHLILIFALAALPFAATFTLYYPDERHYTDGALEMLQGHGWLIPKNADGSPRFEKPPLAYWVIAASYEIFGVNVIASRLPFLLACCGTLWLTHRLALRLTKNYQTALLAALVLISNPQFFLCAIRSIPDALLVFFVTMSAFGFLRLLIFEEFCAGAFWLAYGGAAGAALSKGLLGAGIVLFAWAFAVWQQRDWRAIKKTIHWPSFATTLALVSSWFIYILATRGKTTFAVFFGDQVSGNMHGQFWSPLLRVPQFVLILIFNFLPWSAVVIEWLARKKIFVADNLPPLAQKFILSWTTALIIGFSLGANVSLRYLLPATPLVAILVACWLQNAESARLIFSAKHFFQMILAALVLAVAVTLFVDSQWPLPIAMLVLTCGLFLTGLVALAFGVLRRKTFSATEGLSLAILFGWLLFFFAAMPVLLPDRAHQIAATLKQANPPKNILLVGDLKLASRLRVLLGKNWTVVQADNLYPAAAKNFKAILIPQKEAYHFLDRNWQIQVAAADNGTPLPKELWTAIVQRQLPETLLRHGERYCLAIQK
jgi:4-amino-4-deoxy-L-arabinose transferase-like glycosyltransferase